MTSRLTLRHAAPLSIAALLAFGSHTLIADTGAPGQGPQGATASSPEVKVDDKTVNDFAKAFSSIQQINADLTSELEAASDPAVAQTLQQEAQSEMVEAVEEAGITVNDYNEIATRLQHDQRLAQRVQEAMGDQQ